MHTRTHIVHSHTPATRCGRRLVRALLTAAVGLWLMCGEAAAQEPEPEPEPEPVLTIGGNVYGGGNKGNLQGATSVTINSGTIEGDIFGGARMAGVCTSNTTESLEQLAAKVVINGGDIQRNVYGGNDITGKIHGRVEVNIYGSVTGSVFGGGNGSYIYTEKDAESDLHYSLGDFTTLAEALNNQRPNVGATVIHVKGASAEHPTYIHGSLYCGGNSATLRHNTGGLAAANATLKIGSHAIANKVFLGSNGEDLVSVETLTAYADRETTDLDLTETSTMDTYMQGVEVAIKPTVVFDKDYEDHSSKFGEVFLGGNVGSMSAAGQFRTPFANKITLFDRLVGGCNDAHVPQKYAADDTEKEHPLNAAHEGGIVTTVDGTNDLTTTENQKPKVIIDINGLMIEPHRFGVGDDGRPAYDWTELNTDDKGLIASGNVYGGCCNSGYVNGSVEINVRDAAISEDLATYLATTPEGLTAPVEASMRDYVFSTGLSLFGGGYGKDTEIKGNTTFNISNSRLLKVFGGSQMGTVDGNTTINMTGGYVGRIYGGGFEGPVLGSTILNLDGGQVNGVFGGACNADIGGHTETYLGANGATLPTVEDFVYGGNDLGGKIKGKKDFKERVRSEALPMLYSYDEDTNANPDIFKASTYIEYQKGTVGSATGLYNAIFGGSFGSYDYENKLGTTDTRITSLKDQQPWLQHAFINFRPVSHTNNSLPKLYGGGLGYPTINQDSFQVSSYILVDVPQELNNFTSTEVFGSGRSTGLGAALTQVEAAADTSKAAAIVDLLRGKIKAAYGGGHMEGITRRTIVNVPEGSTIALQDLYGGAYGVSNAQPCDVYESNVNFRSAEARVNNIYGGNNDFRRTLYTQVNVSVPVKQQANENYMATVYGAGHGEKTWAQYTEVNLLPGAMVYEVYGGGNAGAVFNQATVEKLEGLNLNLGYNYDDYEVVEGVRVRKPSTDPAVVGLDNALAKTSPLYNDLHEEHAEVAEKYNTNVHIYEGATVGNYAYGGGLGQGAVVCGTTYIDLLGGRVNKDLYAAGTSGAVQDKYRVGRRRDLNPKAFTASANAYIKGGTLRNVYGGGWRGQVGLHDESTTSTAGDILGETHVYIGRPGGVSLTDGIPAINRNAYGGGEGGAVYGKANLTMDNGYVGYAYNSEGTDNPETADTDERYEEKIDDETWTDGIGANRLYDSGCVFGGGYIDNSNVDSTYVRLLGGHVRNSLFGGGEVAAIGRGVMSKVGSTLTLSSIDKAGRTHVEMYDGHVGRNVFGGGRGYNNLGESGTLNSEGYVFGQTEVDIYGGEIGTDEGMAQGYGNVFGGGDIGYVHSAYETASGGVGRGMASGTRYDDGDEGYYYKYEEDNYVRDNGEKILTEDCKVLIEPWCKVTGADGVTIGGTFYKRGDFVPTEKLNTLKNKTASGAQWGALDDKGIIVHNAVFAGGNTSSGSDKVYANATTVYGNATASIHDVYHRDLITIGTGHTGGLYGDGNLTFVDGYRELNITNYGTDYYSITKEISLDAYRSLPVREQAYYELRYKCVQQCTDKENKTYTIGSTISSDDLATLFDTVTGMILSNGKPNPDYWVENGVCSRYAGRIMNTIQRADFCGVFGSRMVMQGARDRVPDVVDYTNYTINRVREVSLNQQKSIAGDTEEAAKKHGNYFGIYNIVNYLGALTSDVDFKDSVRVTDNKDKVTYGPTKVGQTYEEWKALNVKNRKRNNGNSHNQVALASGVYLELTTEKSTGTTVAEKDWGYITGVVELDLINVQTGVGGGFVYAKNEHGKRSDSGKEHVTLTALNAGAAAKAKFKYDTDDEDKEEWETSGNFIHSTQTIIDDCYDIGGRYKGASAVKAHYWFIKGEVYVYDQYISAYTGAPNAYSEAVNIPITITAASHGKMTLIDVQENRYAYLNVGGLPLREDEKLVINDVTYERNTPINYWDWSLLNATQRSLFATNTYVTIADCKVGVGEELVPHNHVMLKAEYDEWKGKAVNDSVTIIRGDVEQRVPFDFAFRSSNNLSHDTGYILTYDINNPKVWNDWYTLKVGSPSSKITSEAYEALSTEDKDLRYDGPTYRLKDGVAAGVYGQRHYEVADIISKTAYDDYEDLDVKPAEGQATFRPAYVVKQAVTATKGTTPATYTTQHLYPGAVLAKEEYTAANWASLGSSIDSAYVCASTIQLSPTEFIYINTVMTKDEKNAYRAAAADDKTREQIDRLIVPAYYCTQEGLHGGDYYTAGKNYRGLAAWSSLSADDRENFTFNYDALDLLIDPDFGHAAGQKYQYDGFNSYDPANKDKMIYSLETPVDYTATFDETSMTYKDKAGVSHTVVKDQVLTREEFESLPNEMYHYAPVNVASTGNTYVVNKTFMQGNSIYVAGQTISSSDYSSLGDNDKNNIDVINFSGVGTFYYCRSSYTVSENGEGVAVSSSTHASGDAIVGDYAIGDTVPVGVVIDSLTYIKLPNRQRNFTIHGVAPIETSTLYVSRNSDIYDLSTEKIITVIYQYDYEESDEMATHITPVSERHVLNIHIQFKSGVPEIEQIEDPRIVLPGNSISMKTPNVTPGAYEVTSGGWELFEKESDAEAHTNGHKYTPNKEPLYWFQDGFFMAYYATTYLGKTYSNHVKVSVANYHDIDDVMRDNAHHMYVDNPDVRRNSKIYIDNGNCATDPEKSKLDLFYDLFNLSTGAALDGHEALNSHVADLNHLDFILKSDVEPKAYTTWTPIGTADHCFKGWFHGNGYTVSGLDHSLFGHICGNIYNVGVMGSFTSGGIADSGSGHIENTWVSTTATPTGKPIIGDITENPLVYNSYYPKEQCFTSFASPLPANIDVRERPLRDFVNGQVAYNLNSNYLQARYLLFGQKSNAALAENDTLRPVFFSFPDGTIETETVDGDTHNKQYAVSYSKNPADWRWHSGNGFVEDYMKNGDFRFYDGIIPTKNDVSYTGDDNLYVPVFPDDYIYFGQVLNYDLYNEGERPAHDTHPMGIVKDHTTQVSSDVVDNDRHLLLTLDPTTSNRLFRAPAYFRNGVYGESVVFNAKAAFADTYDETAAHQGLTAIDFTGAKGDISGYSGIVPGTETDFQDRSHRYAPLLDYFGLSDFKTRGLTQNLLAYTPASTPDPASAASTTNTVLNNYFNEPVYAEGEYRSVAVQNTAAIKGHLVQLTGSNVPQQGTYKALTDHLLVDKQDFNAPVRYTFDSGKRAWHQRRPSCYADLNHGWEGVCLPFSAELVTTQDKGEITHFYTGSTLAHEYWMREFDGIASHNEEEHIDVAAFTLPNSTRTGTKRYDNTFFWDYYYSQSESLDDNADHYLEGTPRPTAEDEAKKRYYTTTHDYASYPYSEAGKPYLAAFPGARYYEFDLSGSFVPNTAAADIERLDPQVITFASQPAITIEESDGELAAAAVTKDRYTFTPSYLNTTVVADGGYVLNIHAATDPGSTFDIARADSIVEAFRPYFTYSSPAAPYRARSISFMARDKSSIGYEQDDEQSQLDGHLHITTSRGAIHIQSQLNNVVALRVSNTLGLTAASLRLDPGQGVTLLVPRGVYIVAGRKYSVR